MDIDPDAAERLAKEVGEEKVAALLEKIQKKLDYQASMPFHPKKKTAGWFFGVEATICRQKFRAGKRNLRMSAEYSKSVQASMDAFEKGFRPNIDTLYGQLEDSLETAEEATGGKITYEDFKRTKRFLDSLEEDNA
jgi:hypothetical protein